MRSLLLLMATGGVHAVSSVKMIGTQDEDENGNYAFVAHVTVGESTAMQVTLDTTSHRMIVAGSDCKSCWEDGFEAQKHDIAPRVKEGSARLLSEENTSIKYGQAKFEGVDAVERVCLRDQNFCIDEQEIFVVNKDEEGVLSLPENGIMGLARYGHSYFLDKEVQVPDASSFLLNSLGLEEKSFSTNYRSTGNVFTMDFGNKESEKEGAKIPVIDDYFWSSWMQGIQTSNSTDGSFRLERANQAVWNEEVQGVYTIFDSASPDIVISSLWFDGLVEELGVASGGKLFARNDGRIYSRECQAEDPKSGLPTLHFQVMSKMLRVRPYDYIMPYAGAGKDCSTRIVKADIPFMILGVPVYRDYLVDHNFSDTTPNYITFRHANDPTKDVPQTREIIFEKKLPVTKVDPTAGSLELTSLTLSILIGLIIAAIPGGISYQTLINGQDNSQLQILGGFFVFASLGLGGTLAWFIFYPLLRTVFIRLVETSVSTQQKALQTYFAI